MRDTVEEGKEIIRKEGINFSVFKLIISAMMTPRPEWDEEFWIWLYECFAEWRTGFSEPIDEWAEDHFSEFTIENNGSQLKTKEYKWIDADVEKPKYNVGVLVFIPDEDNHITSGMWDISNKWVLLDEYRTPQCKVTHWRKLPADPIAHSA